MTDTHIKIKPVTPRVQYTANGSTTVFPYSFAIFDESEMVVYVDDDIITTGYTVSGAGQTDGGNVTFGTAPEDGKKITLLRNVSIERLTDFQEGGTFRPKNINDEFDRQTAFVQQVQEKVDRTLILPPTSDVDPSQILGEVERIYDSIDNIDAVADNETNVNTVATNISDVSDVADEIENVKTVGENISSVNSVAAVATDVTTVAGITSEVSDVSGIKEDVTAVSGIASNVTTVAGATSNISTVASNISNVNSVGSNISNVNAVAGNATNINAVNANKTNINTVASNVSDIGTVATDIAGVNAVAANISNVNAVAGNESNINSVAANGNDIDTVASNITAVSNVGDNIGNVNTVAADSANITTVVNNITAINAAPTYAAQAKQWAVGDPSEPANGSAKYWAERAHVYTEGVLHEDLISNCILDIPQDINITLSSGTLTVKSGSIITYPNGSQYTTTADKTTTSSSNGIKVLFYRSSTNTLTAWDLNNVFSGTVAPTSVHYPLWFDTSTNKIKTSSDYGSTWTEQYFSLPICVYTVSDGVISSIDKVFNGAGYIGHHAFVLPGVKALIPNGFNDDGSLKSIEYSRNNLSIREMVQPQVQLGYKTSSLYEPSSSGIYVSAYAGEVEDISQAQQYGQWYIKNKNIVVNYNSTTQQFEPYTGVYFLKYVYNGTTVTQFDIRQPIKIATTEMVDSVSDNVSTLDAQNVKLTGNQTIAGTKTFSSTISGSISGNAGTVTNGVYTTGTQTITGDKTFSGAVSLGSSATATTQSAGDNSTSVATTAYADTAISNKIQLVNELPASPVAGVLYLIPEE